MERKECAYCNKLIKEKVKSYHTATCSHGCQTMYHHSAKCFRRLMCENWNKILVIPPENENFGVEEFRNINWEGIPPIVPCQLCNSPIERLCITRLKNNDQQLVYTDSRTNVFPALVREICGNYIRRMIQTLINSSFPNVPYNQKPRLNHYRNLTNFGLSGAVPAPEWLTLAINDMKKRMKHRY
jgi:hypothetical protein